ncbi:MAG: ABC transporter ATP-binding protein [Gemmataceae bacterium]
MTEPIPLIELQQLTRCFGPLRVLGPLSCRLGPGRIGLLGPNGAGKSTLLKILLGLLPASSGAGRILGRDLATARPELRRLIGYMPEADGLVPGLSGVEYVTLAGELCGMPRRDASRRAHEVLTYLELGDARYRPLEQYSLGMKQRLKLAQALIHDPPLLLLDEPTSGLDPTGREAMLELLEKLGREHQKSLILCTHLLGDVQRVCGTVLILHRGQILAQGRVEELRVQRQDRYILQIQGDSADFREELTLEGVQIVTDNTRGEWRVTVPHGFVTRAFFSLAANHGVLIRGLRADEESLEELFHRLLAEADSHDRPQR